jgi:hypothetical protein
MVSPHMSHVLLTVKLVYIFNIFIVSVNITNISEVYK